MNNLEINFKDRRVLLSGGVCSFISWERLIKELRKTKEIKETEIVVGIKISEDGIQYYLEEKNNA